MTARGLKRHIKLQHKRTNRDPAGTQEEQEAYPAGTQEEQEALILQSHAPTTTGRRCGAQQEDDNIPGRRTGHDDEDPQEQVSHVPSRRNSLDEVVHYLKRKSSELIAPLAKKVRKASIPKPHPVTPAATEGMEEGQATGVGLDSTLPSFRPRTGKATAGVQGTGD